MMSRTILNAVLLLLVGGLVVINLPILIYANRQTDMFSRLLDAVRPRAQGA